MEKRTYALNNLETNAFRRVQTQSLSKACVVKSVKSLKLIAKPRLHIEAPQWYEGVGLRLLKYITNLDVALYVRDVMVKVSVTTAVQLDQQRGVPIR